MRFTSEPAHHLGDVFDIRWRREAVADQVSPLVKIGWLAKILGMIFQSLPLHEQPVALRHLVRSLQSHKFAALGALENRRRFLHAGFELSLHAGFYIDLCNLKNHGRKLSVCLGASLWVIGRLLQRADSCAGTSERTQPP